MPDLKHSITIEIDRVEGEDGGIRSVSAMEITLRRNHGALNRVVGSQPRRQDKAA